VLPRDACGTPKTQKGKAPGQRVAKDLNRRCSSFEDKVLVVRRCHSKYTVTWGNRNHTLVITTRHFAPYSVLSRNIRGTRGTSRDRLPVGTCDSADPNALIDVADPATLYLRGPTHGAETGRRGQVSSLLSASPRYSN